MILKKPQTQRTQYEIELLVKYTSEIAFFKNHDSETHEKCLRNMYLEYLEEGRTLFEIGNYIEIF